MALQFSKRLTASVTAFAAMFAAQNGQVYATGTTLGQLNVIYFRLMSDYQILITTPFGFQQGINATQTTITFDAAVTQTLAHIGTMNTLIQSIPDNAVPNPIASRVNPSLVTSAISLPDLKTQSTRVLAQMQAAAAAPDDEDDFES